MAVGQSPHQTRYAIYNKYLTKDFLRLAQQHRVLFVPTGLTIPTLRAPVHSEILFPFLFLLACRNASQLHNSEQKSCC